MQTRVVPVLVPLDEAVDLLEPAAGVVVDVWDGSSRYPERVDEVEFYVPPFTADDANVEIMASMPSLRVVQLLSAGAETFAGRVPEGVTLCTARGAHTGATAEWAVAALLAAVRSIPRFVRSQDAGRWDLGGTGTLMGSTILVLGYGDIGRAVGERLAGFEAEVIGVARTARPADGIAGNDDLAGLLPRADVVILTVPLTDDTAGMVDAAFLAALPDGATVVNAARGAVIDTDALLAELGTGRLRAVLDVTEPEPLPEGHPLWESRNLLLTPHVGGSVDGATVRALEVARAQLQRYLAGEPLLNVVGSHGY